MTETTRATLSVGIFGFAYLLIASEKADKTAVSLLGAVAVVSLGLVPYDAALAAIDLNVVFLLVGMMIIVGVMAESGVFEWVAITIAKRARGNGMAILTAFLLATMSLSALLDNVTTVILIAPITILICEMLELPVVLFLVLEAIASNIGGASTLIGDPPNVIIGSQVGLGFNDFLLYALPAVAAIALVMIPMAWVVLARPLRVDELARDRVMKAEPERAILSKRILRRSLAVFACVLAAFLAGHALSLEPGLMALAGGIVMVVVCRRDVHDALHHVEWATILFFVGLFMLIAALEHNGVFVALGRGLLTATGGNLLVMVMAVLWVSAVGSAIVDNIPLVIAMVPLIESVVPELRGASGAAAGAAGSGSVAAPLYWALALGACLGGNGSLVGASANVVTAQIARRNHYPISFLAFTRIGLPIMLITLVISSVYLYLRFFASAGGMGG